MQLRREGEREEKSFFLQNEPIMSFRINKRIGFVLGLICYSKAIRKPTEAIHRGLGNGF